MELGTLHVGVWRVRSRAVGSLRYSDIR
jgi:hypothetical protein